MAATLADNGFTFVQPVCQNCQTSTTPLWRRDEMGSVLCNACGLFLKLHGRPRPISLKTDVIKSRNRVKSAAHGQRKKVSWQVHVYQIPMLTKPLSSHHSRQTACLHPDQKQEHHPLEATRNEDLPTKPLPEPPIDRIHPSLGHILQAYNTIQTLLPNTFSTE
jgi:GATA-binding protein, other eukaryote